MNYKCRHCNSSLNNCFIDLGSAPPSNAYLSANQLNQQEIYYPLKVMLCEHCWLVQTLDFTDHKKLFNADYAYFSSFSSTWLAHAKQYVKMTIERFTLTKESHVIEIAANDGYLLQFMKEKAIPCTGIEPTHCTALAAQKKGIEIIEDFFGNQLAKDLVKRNKTADLMIANNVLAHVPDINDFVSSFQTVLKPKGVATFEFPYLLELIKQNQFDTIYHEHFSYLSLTAVNTIFASNGLTIFDIEYLPTHGGSVRIFAMRSDKGDHAISPEVAKVIKSELDTGVPTINYYLNFQRNAEKVKNDFVSFLLNCKSQTKKVFAYGAAAKGNTLMNFAGIRPDLIACVIDKNPAKQGNYMPGSRIPIQDETIIKEEQPDFIVILPWNLSTEIMNQLDYIRQWQGQFVVAVPALEIL